MTMIIGEGVEELLGSSLEAVGLQVLTTRYPAVAAVALEEAVVSLLESSPDTINASGVVLVPGGPLVSLRGLRRARLRPTEVISHLRERLDGAVPDGRLVAHPTLGLSRLDNTPNAVILRAFPPPADGRLPTTWLDLAGDWLVGDLDPESKVQLRVLGVEFEVTAADAPGVLHQATAAGTWCDAFAGDLDHRIRTASVSFGAAPHLALGTGGPEIDSHGILARFDLLCDAATEFIPSAAYVCVDLEATFAGLATGLTTTWPDEGGAPPLLVAGRLADIAVPDIFPFQILGTGHRQRLGEAIIEEIADELDSGHFAVVAGDPYDWLPIHDVHDEVQRNHRELLKPLLLDAETAAELVDARVGDADEQPGASSRAGPPLEEIVLDATGHARRGLRLTILELVAWMGQHPHSDEPPGVSPVLATFVRLFAQGLSDDDRQRLKPLARQLIGTADPATTPYGLGPLDRARAWLATDWAIRVQGPAWLRAAGLTEAADTVEATGSLEDQRELLVAIEHLGQATTTASRRIEITVNIASREPDETSLLEEVTWNVWEQASEESAWVASSEAASQGVSAELLYATDLRVIECSRDPRLRDDLLTRRSGIADQAWSAALSAIAAEAWREGWRVAGEVAFEQSTFSLDTVMSRSLSAVGDDLGLDAEAAEAAHARGEDAARASLSEAALRGGTTPDGLSAWETACRAARSVRGGEAWGLTYDAAAEAIGPDTHREAMAAARKRVERLLSDAPDAVARTVAAAVAREVAGAAGRSIALRAAAIARAHAADEAETEKRAAAALEPTVRELRESAFDLLSSMIDIEGSEPES